MLGSRRNSSWIASLNRNKKLVEIAQTILTAEEAFGN
jgi:hypothetical protein